MGRSTSSSSSPSSQVQPPSLLTIPSSTHSHQATSASPSSPGVDALLARLGAHGADSLLTPTVFSAVARKGSLDVGGPGHSLLLRSSSPPEELTLPTPTPMKEVPEITCDPVSAPHRTFSSDSIASSTTSSTTSHPQTASQTTTTPAPLRKHPRGRRMSSHVTLANTSVGLREIAAQIGRATLKWESPPRTVLVVTKVHDPELVKLTRGFADWLVGVRGMTVWVEERLKEDPVFGWNGEEEGASFEELTEGALRRLEVAEQELSPSPSVASTASSFATASTTDPRIDNPDPRADAATPTPTAKHPRTPGTLRFWRAATCESECASQIDLIVTLGGDGTVLFTASLFQTCRVPPILPFDLGSLGFLAVFDYADHREILRTLTEGEGAGFAVNMRMRLACTVWRRVVGAEGETHVAEKTFHVLNELVVDRGPSPYMSELELFVDDAHLTTMQADGLVVATPTGSTAYSLSANGSMVHPAVPTILVTPICPHTLSFRPMLLPDSIELRVVLPVGSRTASACASFDGRGRVELGQGDFVSVTMSRFPVPTVSREDQSRDWIESLRRCLHWNVRARQKAFA
ncbi:hypothetical protein HDU96_007807 [Phlyctochytrium bullatum]|nr:hypothetical protein HDU96_007807 [Phlyctochytrium bullatum]